MRILGLFLGLFVGTPLAAQFARAPVTIYDATSGPYFDVSSASDGDLSAASFVDTSVGGVFVATSDGRGVTWSTPVRVDGAPPGTFKFSGWSAGNPSVAVAGSSIYVVWYDTRSTGAGKGVYFGRSTDAGATWTETRLDDGFAPGTSGLPLFTLSVSPDLAGDHLYVAMAGRASGGSPIELHLTASHDGGATWAAAVDVSTMNGTFNATQPALSSEGMTLHCAWSDRRNSLGNPDIYYRRSTDGGATFGSESQLDGSGPASGYAENENIVVSAGSTVAVAWLESPAGFSEEAFHAVISTDGGTTFGPDQQIGSYAAGTVKLDGPDCVVTNGNFVAMWQDYRSGSPRAYTSTTTDAGATWTPDLLLNSNSASAIRVEAGGCDVVGTWSGFFSGIGSVSEAVLSTDAGLTWSTPVALSDLAGVAGVPAPSFNSLYRNWICAWGGSVASVWAVQGGGVRPQTLTPVGFTGGASSVNFQLSGFGGDPFAVVAASASPGTFPLSTPGGVLDLGLTFDALFNLTLSDPIHFLAFLGGLGQASTAPFPISLSGVTLYAAALSFDFALNIGELTDVVPITIP